jgi:hypothetical protein
MSFLRKIAALTALAIAVVAITPATAEASGHKGKTHSAQQAKKHGAKKHAKHHRHHKKGHHKAHHKGAHKK